MKLQQLKIKNFHLSDHLKENYLLSYQIFGQPLHKAPIVLVNHALTGNSSVAGEKGWWKEIVGIKKVIDLQKYTVISIDIPGNGYNQILPGKNDHLLTTQHIAQLFWKVLDELKVKELYAIIGGSLGGSIGWEMVLLKPFAVKKLIPIACSVKSSDWLIGNVKVQEHILNNSLNPVEDARMHAMLLYRTPHSFSLKFNGKKEEEEYAIENWLKYHGNALKDRFSLPSYKLMNHLLKTIGKNLTQEDLVHFAYESPMDIHSIAIDSDYLFTQKEQRTTFKLIQKHKSNISYHEIRSVHGHDAFLIEYQQLENIIKPLL